VRRCLHTLIKLGYATTDGRTYSLLPKVLTLGHAYLSSTPLAVSAQPYLDRMSEQLHEACNMATLEGDDILYIARSATTQRLISVDLSVGGRCRPIAPRWAASCWRRWTTLRCRNTSTTPTCKPRPAAR
jgi:IclR family pca regulon transcriptional regulator